MNDPITVVSEFDRLVGALEGLPDVHKSKPSTVRAYQPLIGIARSYIVQTYRQKDKGDTIFLETVGNEGAIRISIPPQVADAIARQREALSTMARRKIGKESMRQRMAEGWKPNLVAMREGREKKRKAARKEAKAKKA